MNTFFRQKLTNKTIDLLEKVEDRKTREQSKIPWENERSWGAGAAVKKAPSPSTFPENQANIFLRPFSLIPRPADICPAPLSREVRLKCQR